MAVPPARRLEVVAWDQTEVWVRRCVGLGTIETAVVQGRPVAVTEIAGPSDAGGCQIVFIGAAVTPLLEEVLAALPASPLLTVGDTPRFAERGGTIGFTTQRNRVQLELNLQSAEASGLPVSSQLIRLATIVREPAGSGST